MLHPIITTCTLIIVFIGSQSCNTAPAPPPLEPDNFKSYYAKWLVLRELAVLTPYDSTVFDVKSDSLRQAFGLSGEDVRRMLEYYQDSLPGWERFLSEVRDSIEQTKTEQNPPPNR